MKHDGMKWMALALLAAMAGSAAADDGRWKVSKPGVVTDTFTDTQWTQRDNLGDINWHDAKAYCVNLALDGGGWQLPTMGELSQFYSGAQGNAVNCGGYRCIAPKVFYLTSTSLWSHEEGKSSSEAMAHDLSGGHRNSLHITKPTFSSRALCVRRRS